MVERGVSKTALFSGQHNIILNSNTWKERPSFPQYDDILHILK